MSPTTPTNPLLEDAALPPFSRIRAEHVRPAIEELLAASRKAVAALLGGDATPSWETVVEPIEALEDRLDRAWAPVAHLHAVADQPALREAYNACLPLLSDHATEMAQNEALHAAYRAIAEGPEWARLDGAQRKVIENALREFRLAGVALPSGDKRRFRDQAARLAELASRFEENLLDATRAWTRSIEEQAELAGIPASARSAAAERAEREGRRGWLFGLDFPSYHALVTHAERRELRREAYTAYHTRASDQGPHAGRWDNGAVIEEILALRHHQARLLGFRDYAELSLERKMARSPEEVLDLLGELAARARPVAERELTELAEFARAECALERLEAWDLAYCAERLRQRRHALAEEELRPYFPAPRVLEGLFTVARRLFGIRVVARDGVDVWHPEVRFFELRDERGELRGQFYLDLYARPSKRGGAWMDDCVVRRRHGEHLQTPVAFLTCNFTPPTRDRPSLLTHDEVTTLFHEFGHGLHHLLTRVDHPSVAGINGVPWDAVELPSQLLENWCWEREALELVSGHWESGEPLPGHLIERLRAARTFQAGLQTLRQVEFALFDLRLHRDYDPARGARVAETLEAVRREVAVLRPPPFTRFAHGFSHIFGGGYAAGYYSYKWAEVLAADAFERFEQAGIFDPETGQAFRRTVLEQGGARDALELFIEFRGREPRVEALLRQCGILATAGEETGAGAGE